MFTPLPIVSLGNLLTSVISFLVAGKLYRSYRQNKSQEIRNFFLTFVFLALFFLASATPGIFSSDPVMLSVFNNVSIPVVHLAAMFFTIIPLNLFRLETLKKAYIAMVIGVMSTALVLRVIGFAPMVPLREGDFIFWLRPENPFVQWSFLLSGTLLFTSVVLGGLVFLFYALRNKDNRYVFLRSSIVGSSAIFLGVVAAIIAVTSDIAAQTIASVLATVALVFLAFGIFYRREESSSGDRGGNEVY